MSAPGYESYRESGVRHIGDLPTHWSLVALKRVATFTYGDALAADVRGEGDIKVFGSNGPVGTHSAPNTSAPVVFVGRKGSCGALTWSDAAGFAIDTVYYVDPSCCRADLRWLYWTLHTLGLEHSSQDTGVPGLSREVAHSSPVPLPPPAEQVAIAAFLDRETGKIDALVEAQTRLIELLKEKRQAVISHAVTKGLDPAAPMKDSGVEWLGQVPAHWEVSRLKFVARIQTGVAKGKTYEQGDTCEVPYLRVANVQAGWIDLTDVATIELPAGDIDRYRLQAGDVLMNEGGDFDKLGRGAVWDGAIDPCVHQNHVFSVRPVAVSPEWLDLTTSSSAAQFFFKGRSKQSTNLASISSTNLMELPMLVPPVDEQASIVEYVVRACSKLDELMSGAAAAITLLQQRRAALISAAVTGKIDVRGLAPEQAVAA